VDAEASSPDYGTIRILRLPGNTQIAGPGQISNAFIADRDISTALLPFKQSNTQALFGNLLTLPVQRRAAVRPAGLHASPGHRRQLPGAAAGAGVFRQQGGFRQHPQRGAERRAGYEPQRHPRWWDDSAPAGSRADPPTPGTGDALSLLQQADAKYAEAREALANQDLAGYQAATEQAQSLVQQALAQLQGESPSSPGPTGSSPSPAPTASPTG
jgi:uncharacterized membrane protein (UPF0182 family)